jgi:hypothetical protein
MPRDSLIMLGNFYAKVCCESAPAPTEVRPKAQMCKALSHGLSDAKRGARGAKSLLEAVRVRSANLVLTPIAKTNEPFRSVRRPTGRERPKDSCI